MTGDETLLVAALRDELEQDTPTIFGVLHRAADALAARPFCTLACVQAQHDACPDVAAHNCECACHEERLRRLDGRLT